MGNLSFIGLPVMVPTERTHAENSPRPWMGSGSEHQRCLDWIADQRATIWLQLAPKAIRSQDRALSVSTLIGKSTGKALRATAHLSTVTQLLQFLPRVLGTPDRAGHTWVL